MVDSMSAPRHMVCFPYVLAKFPQESVEDQQYYSDLPKAGDCLQCGHVGKLAEQNVSCVDSMLQLSNSSLGRTRAKILWRKLKNGLSVHLVEPISRNALHGVKCS